MNEIQRAIRSIQWKLGIALFLKYLIASLAVYLLLLGTLVLILRAGIGVSAFPVWTLAFLPLILGAAYYVAWRRVPGDSAVRAFIDSQSAGGGLIMAGEVCELGGWRTLLPKIAATRVHWSGKRPGTAFLFSLLFAVACSLIPERYIAAGLARKLEVGPQVEQLAMQIETLKEEKILKPEKALEMKEKLDAARREARGENPAKTLETLDHLENVAKREAAENAEKTIQETDSLAKARALADLLRKKSKEMDSKTKKEGLRELSRMMPKEFVKDLNPEALDREKDSKTREDALRELSRMTPKDLADLDLDPEALDALKDLAGDRELSPEELEALSKALKRCEGKSLKKMGKLVKAKLIDPDQLKECEGACKNGEEALAAFLLAKGDQKKLARLACKSCSPRGRGGVSDDPPGDTPLTWKDKSSEKDTKFKETVLPPGSLAGLKNGQAIGVQSGAPDGSPKTEASRGGALAQTEASGGDAKTQVILPRHRGAAERYFERSAEK